MGGMHKLGERKGIAEDGWRSVRSEGGGGRVAEEVKRVEEER